MSNGIAESLSRRLIHYAFTLPLQPGLSGVVCNRSLIPKALNTAVQYCIACAVQVQHLVRPIPGEIEFCEVIDSSRVTDDERMVYWWFIVACNQLIICRDEVSWRELLGQRFDVWDKNGAARLICNAQTNVAWGAHHLGCSCSGTIQL